MSNSYFQFKQFIIHQDRTAMKVTTDACLFGAWVASYLSTGSGSTARLLDIGTGTGLLSLMIAQKIQAHIDAIEIDPEASKQAISNIHSSPWEDRIRVINEDIHNYKTTTMYDVIISNPPFYENELKSPDKKKNQAHHEGISLKDLLSTIKEKLASKGVYFLLLPYKRIDEIPGEVVKSGLVIERQALVRQSADHPYSRVMIRGRHVDQSIPEISTSEIAIRNISGGYSEAFVELLRDYYLYL